MTNSYVDEDKLFRENERRTREWIGRLVYYIGYCAGDAKIGQGKRTLHVPVLSDISSRLRIYWEMDKYGWAKINILRDDKMCGIDFHYDNPFESSVYISNDVDGIKVMLDTESIIKETLPNIHIDMCYICESRLRLSHVSGYDVDEYKWICDKCQSVIKANGRDTSGYVYLMGNETSGYFKIGKSNEPKRRLSQVKSPIPFEIRVIHVIPCDDMHTAEGNLHSIYSSKRSKGEWFTLSEDDVAAIASIESFSNGIFRLDKNGLNNQRSNLEVKNNHPIT